MEELTKFTCKLSSVYEGQNALKPFSLLDLFMLRRTLELS